MGRHGGGWPGGPGAVAAVPLSSAQEHPDGKKVLQRISQETGGRFFEVSKKEPIDQIYDSIAEELRNQYSLGYTPDKASAGRGLSQDHGHHHQQRPDRASARRVLRGAVARVIPGAPGFATFATWEFADLPRPVALSFEFKFLLLSR